MSLRDVARRVADQATQRARALGLGSLADRVQHARRGVALARILVPKHFYRVVDRAADTDKLMINVGAGPWARRHWRVLDYPSKWYDGNEPYIDYPIDLWSSQRWPIASGSVAFFFSSHTFEHIPQEHCPHMLRELYRCLRPGGALRVVVPDFDLGYDAYAGNDLEFFAKYAGETLADRFLDFAVTSLRGTLAPEALRADFESLSREELAEKLTASVDRASQRECPGNHINWWNYAKLSRALSDAGFERVYRSAAQQSRFAEMVGGGRWVGFDDTHPELSLFVEAIKRPELEVAPAREQAHSSAASP